MISLDGSPYSLERTSRWVLDSAQALHRRVDLLREQGRLTEQTLRDYFGNKRFEQIAESIGIEGSTLSVGETELAVQHGITITGHDPAHSADAVNLSMALDRMIELARAQSETGILYVKELHALILRGTPQAGLFRSKPVVISGSAHRPPKTWHEIIADMEDLEKWSADNAGGSPLLRAVVLHTWLTHIHPFTDGNGRTARAVMNLELIRAGFPSVIIRRKDRIRYYEALAESDAGGDLGPISELILTRAEDALRDLERAAKTHEGYDRIRAELRKTQRSQFLTWVSIWNDAVRLLFSLVNDAAEACVGDTGSVSMRWYDDELSLDEFKRLCQGDPRGNFWMFRVDVEVPGFPGRRFLAWTGYRSHEMKHGCGIDDGPSVFWSIPDPSGYKQWVRDDSRSPGVAELTLELPMVDRWLARLPDGYIGRLEPSVVARRVAEAVVEAVVASLADSGA